MTVEIRVLGPLEVRSERGSIGPGDFRSRKSRRVLEVLALSGGQIVSKDVLIDTLWRSKHPANPAATVEVAVSLLRSVLARVTDAPVVVTEPGGYRLDDHVMVDMVEFDRALAAAEQRADEERVSVLSSALSLVRGPLLDGEPAADWLSPHRDRARRRVGIARLLLARSALRAGDTALAFDAAEAAWTNAEVVLAEAYAIGATSLLLDGKRSDALALVHTAEQRLEHEADGMPSPALAEVRRRLQAPFGSQPADRPVHVDAVLHSLPSPLPFLGRTAVRAAIETAVDRMLAGGTNTWLHLEGARGMGTTRTLGEVPTWVSSRSREVQTLHLAVGEGDAVVPLLLAERLFRLVPRAEPSTAAETQAADPFPRLAAALDRAGPSLLLIDDLHRADPASRAVLAALVAPGGTVATTVVSGGGRSPEGATAWPLPLLGADDLADVGGTEVWAATGGHPLVLAACAAAAAGDGVIHPSDVLRLRAIIGDLGRATAEVVVLLADKRRPVSLGELGDALGLERGALRAAAAAAVDAGVLRWVSPDSLATTSYLFSDIFAH